MARRAGTRLELHRKELVVLVTHPEGEGFLLWFTRVVFVYD